VRRILFVGEGVTDVGDTEVSITMSPSGSSDDCGCKQVGVIPILTARCIGGLYGDSPPQFQRLARETRRLHGRGFAKKVRAAVADAIRAEADAVVFVSDRGGAKNRERLSAMQRGKEESREKGLFMPTVVGLAIEELEAWLLADAAAVSTVSGVPAKGATQDPETIEDPKNTLRQQCEGDTSGRREWQRHEAIAQAADINALVTRCPKGFKPFHDEIRTALLPLFGG